MVTQPAYCIVPANFPGEVHFVECDHGKWGREFRATGPKLTDGDIAKLIHDGEIDSKIVRVLAVNAFAGTCRVVTREIASLVFYMADSAGDGFDRLSSAARDMLTHAGFDLDAAQSEYDEARAVEEAGAVARGYQPTLRLPNRASCL